VVANFSHGHHGDATDADNPRVRWRYDPKMAGVSGQFADCGIHAMHMASFVAGDEVRTLSADFASTIASRELEDDAMVNEQPNQVFYTPVGERTQIMEKGEGGLSDEAGRLSRVAIAHPEGFPLAVANIYVDLAAAIQGEVRDGLPLARDGVRSMAAVYGAVESADKGGVWVDARPPMYR